MNPSSAAVREAKLVELVPDELFRLKIPMEIPAPPGTAPSWSGSMNSYLVRGADGRWLVLDPGFCNTTGVNGWRRALRTLGTAPEELGAVLVTHAHADHVGLAGWLAGQSGRAVWMHPLDIDAYRCEWRERAANAAAAARQMVEYAVPEGEAAEIAAQAGARGYFVAEWDRFTALEEGMVFPLRTGGLRAVHVPGHSDGQCVFFWPERGYLFSADFLLPATFAPIGLHWYGDRNPVGTAMASLRRVMGLELDGLTALPGHGWAIPDPGARCAQTLAAYEERSRHYEQLCAGGADTAWAAALETRRRGDQRPMRSCIWEAMAYLEYLAREGRLRRERRPGGLHFRKS